MEPHGHTGKEAALGGAAHEDENFGVTRILGDGIGEFRDGRFLALEALKEVTVFIEKHASDAEGVVFGASALKHGFDFGDVEIFRSGTDVDDAKHGLLRTRAKYTGEVTRAQ